MGNGVSTGTVCPFPYTTADGSPPVVLADCTTTYAVVDAPLYDIVDGILLASSAFCWTLALYRLASIWAFHRRTGRTPGNLEFWGFGALFCGAVFFESIDLFGMRGLVPPFFYYFMDEIVAATALCLGLVLVDFWVRLAKGFGNAKNGIPVWEFRGFILLCYCNFPAWIIVGTAIPSMYEIAEGVKISVSALLCGWLVFASWRSVRDLIQTLNATSSVSDDMHAHVANNKINKTATKILLRKYGIFIFVVTVAGIACVIDAVQSFSLASQGWLSVPADVFDPIQLVLKFVWVIVLFMTAYYFRLPQSMRRTSAHGLQVVGHSGGGGGGGAHHVQQLSSTVEADTRELEPTPQFTKKENSRKSKRTVLRMDILETDGERHRNFYQFVQKRFGGETVDFYNAVLRFRKLSTQSERDAAGKDIVARFVTSDSPDQVLFPEAMIKQLRSLETFSVDVFEPAQRIAFQTLKENFLSAFLKWEEEQEEDGDIEKGNPVVL